MRVGIFWFVAEGGQTHLITDTTALDQAEPYGKFLTHAASHYDFWTKLQQRPATALQRQYGTAAPRLAEYEDWPRGRIVYHQPTRAFIIYADRQLHLPTYRAQIQRTFNLPPDTPMRDDSHYARTRRLPPLP